jgi:hypothetical protein
MRTDETRAALRMESDITRHMKDRMIAPTTAGTTEDREWVWGAVILLIALFSNLPLIYGQFSVHDEALHTWVCTKILYQFHDWHGVRSLINVGLILSYEDQPPLRFLLSLPGMLLFRGTEFGPRAVSIAFSVIMTWQVMQLGRDLGGRAVAYASGLLVATSAVYNWTSMTFGWSVAVTMLIVAMRRFRIASLDLSDSVERRSMRIINLALVVAFLINTGNVLFFVMSGILYAWANRRRLVLFIKSLAPFVAFYALYYAFFMAVVPWYAQTVAKASRPLGQAVKNAGRFADAHPNITSLLENLRGLNGHYAPYLEWAFFACAVIYLIRKAPRLALWLAPFVLLWSFYFMIYTHQYIILTSICIVPFGVACLSERLSRRAFFHVVGGLAACFALWNVALYVKPYTELGYPAKVWRWGYAERGQRHNIVRPWGQVCADMRPLLGPDGRFVENVDGSFALFYCKDDPWDYVHTRRAATLGREGYDVEYDPEQKQYHIRFSPADTHVCVVFTEYDLFPSEYVKRISYPGSRAKLYLLSPTISVSLP